MNLEFRRGHEMLAFALGACFTGLCDSFWLPETRVEGGFRRLSSLTWVLL